MIKKLVNLIWTVAVFCISANAQKMTPEQYVEKYKDLAIKEMKRMGVPAAITLAQGLLETESGNSDLVKKSNNHFGIKCKSSWTSDAVTHDDEKGECFRSYKDAEASYRDHSNYLRGMEWYAFLFQLDPLDYKAWAKGLRKAGYATNPKYPDILIKNIEQYNLQQYSLIGAQDMPQVDKSKYQDDKEPAPEKATSADNTEPANSSESQPVNYINGHKYINAKKGTSLLAIATGNDIDLSKLLSYNDLEEDGILKDDQIIFLQKKSKTGASDFYIAQQQEPLHDIAQKNGIQLKYLLLYNDMKEDTPVAAGTKLYLSPVAQTQQAAAIKDAVASTVSKKEVPAPHKIHTVQPKEGLYSIAKKYQVTIQQLRQWNNLTTDNLRIGQELVVSE
ncbi:glucosaminidase domain-containing protein [Ferruginibacter paludis]|uniref:glucosaminidase domain-containing protein n=1 Tax=Ferruginibacter paludis TaxID=1310417 RepID=UPI0025B52FC7|nr:glucosaminidase domain-containing protein [Ferruginibacter paludis]MDN3654596.1 glucosaminidase domain-containing protein [Ferruginibacter paludis]